MATAQNEAMQRAKNHYDGIKKSSGDSSSDAIQNASGVDNEVKESFARDVRGKRDRYIQLGGTEEETQKIKKGKQRIYNERAEISNRRSYYRTHGGNPNNK